MPNRERGPKTDRGPYWSKGADQTGKARERLGLTQAALAEDLEASQSTISRIERGIEAPTSILIELIATRLGVDRGLWLTAKERRRIAKARAASGKRPRTGARRAADASA